MKVMYQDDDKVVFTDDDYKPNCVLSYSKDGVGTAVKSIDEWSLSINTKNLKIVQQDIGLTVDIPDDVLSQVSSIEINGFKFIKEK